MYKRITITLPDNAIAILAAIPGDNQSAKIADIVSRYHTIVSIRPELAFPQEKAVSEHIRKLLA